MSTLTRRAFLRFAAIVPLLALTSLRSNTSMADDEELIIVEGWFLRKSDVLSRRR